MSDPFDKCDLTDLSEDTLALSRTTGRHESDDPLTGQLPSSEFGGMSLSCMAGTNGVRGTHAPSRAFRLRRAVGARAPSRVYLGAEARPSG